MKSAPMRRWNRETGGLRARSGFVPAAPSFTNASPAWMALFCQTELIRMLAIVRLALKRPYTFIVMAILIVIFGGLAVVRTPTDIFPDIRIPVIAAVWTYRGLSPDDMAGRVIYYYERQLSLAVNDIDHIESQSLPGVGIVKIFFHPTVDIRTATAQVTSLSQTVLKQMPPGITPPLILNYNASTVPILQLGLSSPSLAEKDIFDLGQNFIRPALASVQGAGVPSPYGGKERQIQIDLDPQKLQADNLSAAGSGQCAGGAEPDHSRRHHQGRPVRI